MVRRALLAAVLLALTATPAAAREVARDGAYVLEVRRGGDGPCLTLTGPPGSAEACAAAAAELRLGQGLEPVRPVLQPRPRVATYAAAVPPAVRAVALETRAGVTRYPTVAVPGYRARFVLAADAGRAALVRLYGRGGELLVAVADPDAPDPTDRVRAFRGGGTTIRLSRALDVRPDPAARDRAVPATCVVQRTGGAGSEGCTADEDLGAGSLLEVGEACAPDRPILSGLVRGPVARIAVNLGDGRVLRRPVRALPAAYGAVRLVAVAVPRGAAVRGYTLRAADGRRLVRRSVGAPPGGYPCRDGEGIGQSVSVSLTGSRGDGPLTTVARAGGHALRVGDDGRRGLCVGLDGARATCLRAPLWPEEVLLDQRGRIVFGSLPGTAERVTIRFADGRRRTYPTVAGDAYRGLYAGTVRFLLADLPPGTRATRFALLDGAGRRLGGGRLAPRVRVRRLGRVPGTPLRVRVLRVGDRRAPCVTLPGTPGCGENLVATCSPRRVLAYGAVTRRSRPPDLVLRDGRRLDPRIVRHRGVRVWIAAVPRGAAVRAVVRAGRLQSEFEPRREPLRVPPADRQCGYVTSLY